MQHDDKAVVGKLAKKLAEATRVAVLTGAGVSAESGVPTFRGPQGLWKKFRPEELATPEAFAAFVDDNTRLVSVAWVSHQNGYHHNLVALAELAHAHGAYLYADAIQGIGMLTLDVKAVDIDFLTTGTYKWLLGGYGVAPFYVREALLDSIAIDRMAGQTHYVKYMCGPKVWSVFRIMAC